MQLKKILLMSVLVGSLSACNPPGAQRNHTGGYEQQPGVTVRDELPGVLASPAPGDVGFSDHLNGSNLRSTGMVAPNGVSGQQNQARRNNSTFGHTSNPGR